MNDSASDPQPSEPQPSEPQPSEPQPSELQPSELQQSDPQPSEPQPSSAPQPTPKSQAAAKSLSSAKRQAAAKKKVPSERQAAWGRLLGLFLFRVVWRGVAFGTERVPKNGPLVFAANHVHVLDGPLLMGLTPRPQHILTKQEMFHGFVGLILRSAGQIPTDRANGRGALLQGLAVLHDGGAVGIFPEGARGSGEVAQARVGAAWLAVNAGAKVVPVAILGTRLPGESTSRLPRLWRRAYIEFGEPIDVAAHPGPRRAAVAEGTEVIRAAMADLVTDLTRRTGVELPTSSDTAE